MNFSALTLTNTVIFKLCVLSCTLLQSGSAWYNDDYHDQNHVYLSKMKLQQQYIPTNGLMISPVVATVVVVVVVVLVFITIVVVVDGDIHFLVSCC